ncbi:MAG: hypothetical protein QMD96_00445 [Anaerosomatales bacterium]|nr:hypothetical protein [Anaerosomatales bacterium]
MGDVPRREPRKFEPPPWERDAFEELRRRKEQEQAERELEEALQRAEAVESADETRQPGPAEQAAPVPPAATEDGAAAADGSSGLDERLVERMLIQLSLEEPKATQHVGAFANAVAAAMAAAGLGFVVWSAVLFARTRAANGDAVPAASPLVTTIASLLMMLWGFMMIGGGVLLWRKHNVR